MIPSDELKNKIKRVVTTEQYLRFSKKWEIKGIEASHDLLAHCFYIYNSSAKDVTENDITTFLNDQNY